MESEQGTWEMGNAWMDLSGSGKPEASASKKSIGR